jgi:hypothetical protein
MTCNWFDKTSEENIGSTKKPEKTIEDNKTDINKNMIQLTYQVWFDVMLPPLYGISLW